MDICGLGATDFHHKPHGIFFLFLVEKDSICDCFSMLIFSKYMSIKSVYCLFNCSNNINVQAKLNTRIARVFLFWSNEHITVMILVKLVFKCVTEQADTVCSVKNNNNM